MTTKTTTTAAAPLTKRQRECKHPPQYVHPTYDDRWETCDLCRIVRPRPIPAPWIVAHDESLPPPPAPALFAAMEEQTEPEPIKPEPRKQLVTVPKIAPEMAGFPPKRVAGGDRAERERRWDETCPRCAGKRRVIEQPIFPHGAQPVNIVCPRCRGAGQIVAYRVGSSGSQQAGGGTQTCA